MRLAAQSPQGMLLHAVIVRESWPVLITGGDQRPEAFAGKIRVHPRWPTDVGAVILRELCSSFMVGLRPLRGLVPAYGIA